MKTALLALVLGLFGVTSLHANEGDAAPADGAKKHTKKHKAKKPKAEAPAAPAAEEKKEEAPPQK